MTNSKQKKNLKPIKRDRGPVLSEEEHEMRERFEEIFESGVERIKESLAFSRRKSLKCLRLMAALSLLLEFDEYEEDEDEAV
jgi:hypothetical protein